MSGSFKSFIWAFVVGGAAGVLYQFLLVLIPLSGVSENLVSSVALVVMGVLGSILYVLKVFNKLFENSGAGAILPFFALPPAVSISTVEALKQNKPMKSVIGKGFMSVIPVFGIGAVFCFALVIVFRFIVKA